MARALEEEFPDAEKSGARRRDPIARASGEHEELGVLARFAGYEVLARIAVGGMAEVFLARERSDAGARHVALKVIRQELATDRELAEMFARESKVAIRLRHPNVCHTYRTGIEDGRPWLAMELVTGVTLRDLVGRGPVPAPIAIRIASTVAEALHSAHVAKDEKRRPLQVVHQDVSPQNVMIAHDGSVKLLDFGVAQSTLDRRRSDPGEGVEVRGKIAYLAPEQVIGRPIDARADVFALGVVLLEMLTAERVFKRATTEETMRAIVRDPPPRALLDRIPPALEPVILRALAKKPSDRYPTAAALQDDLELALVEERVAVTSARIARHVEAVLGRTSREMRGLEIDREAVASLVTTAPRKAPQTAVFDLVTINRGVAAKGVEPTVRTTSLPGRRRWGRALTLAFVLAIAGLSATCASRVQDRAESATSRSE